MYKGLPHDTGEGELQKEQGVCPALKLHRLQHTMKHWIIEEAFPTALSSLESFCSPVTSLLHHSKNSEWYPGGSNIGGRKGRLFLKGMVLSRWSHTHEYMGKTNGTWSVISLKMARNMKQNSPGRLER